MIDLLEYITSRYPESIKRSRVSKNGSWHSIRAVWRGENNASCGLKWYGDRWRFSDYATGQHGDVVDFLMQVEGYDKTEALRIAGGFHKPSSPVSARKPAAQETVEEALRPVSDRTRAFANQSVRELRRDGVPKVWAKRGFTAADCNLLKLGRNGEDGVLPILRGKQLVNVKIRLSDTSRGKYRYAEPGHGSPAWYSPNIETADKIILLEGELNAMAVYVSVPEYGVIGMAGASQPVTKSDLEVINGRPVYVMADDDEAGRQAALRWCSQLSSCSGVLRPLGKQDACDVHGCYGKLTLKRHMLKRILEVDNSKPSGRDGAFRSWVSTSESVRDRAVSIARAPGTARLTPLHPVVAKGLYLLCVEFPELRRYAMRLGKNTILPVALALKTGHLTAQYLADTMGVDVSTAHTIMDDLAERGIIHISWDGRTKIGKLVGTWKQVLNALLSIVKAQFAERLARYLAGFRLDRDIFWQWLETTVQGWRHKEAHSGLVRLPATSY